MRPKWRQLSRRYAAPRRTCAMCGRRTALAVALLAAIVAGTGRAHSQSSLELGALRAVPSRGPALVFQLPFISQAHAPLGMPTVVIRRPSNALFFVANKTLELRLLELADVELEVSHAGQTVNRLLLKTELETARARMLSSIKRDRDQAAKTGDGKSLGPARSSMAALERQMVGLRGEIQQLVDHVATLADMAKRAGVEHHREQWTSSWVLAVMLGGLLVAGLASLLTSHVMRLRGLAAVIERVRDALLTARLIPLPCASMVPPDAPGAVPATTDLETTRANLWQELITAQKRDLGLRDRQRTENHNRLQTAVSTHIKASKADIQP